MPVVKAKMKTVCDLGGFHRAVTLRALYEVVNGGFMPEKPTDSQNDWSFSSCGAIHQANSTVGHDCNEHFFLI